MTASQNDCIFCKIASGQLGVPFVHESEHSVAFRDQTPAAREHVLVVPKRHVESLDAVTREDDALVGDLFETARNVARLLGIEGSGYRLVTNVGTDAGQTVFHLHVHILGGEKLGRFGA